MCILENMLQMGIIELLLNLQVEQLLYYTLDRRSIADKIIGIKLKLITNNGVFTDKNLDKTINNARNIADKTIFFNFDI